MTSTPTATRGFPAPLARLLLFLPIALALLPGCAAPLEGMEKEVKPADLEALKAVGAKVSGLIVWTSSRAGQPHLFSMRTDGSETKQLTKGDSTDWRPRFSPDGRKILFQRSRDKDFVRERDANADGAWDLYMIDSDGRDLTKVVDNATWGSWTGPDEIVFLRGSKIMRTKLGAEGETKVMDTARYPLFAGVTVQQPELSHDGHFVALTLTGTHRQVGIWSIKKKTWTQMGQGAQIAWAPDCASVYWADDAGKEQGRIAREPVVAGTPADEKDPDKIRLVDLGGKRSRERFPRLSSDGKWLVFAAAIGDLENDLEDFELFLWEVGSSPTSATRMTFHSANDRWPDVYIGETGKPPTTGAEEPSEPAQQKTDKTEETPKAEKTDDTETEGAKAAPAKTEPVPAAGPDEVPDEGAAPASTGKAKGKKKKHR